MTIIKKISIVPIILLILIVSQANVFGAFSLEPLDLNGDSIKEKASLQFTEPDESNQYHATLSIESNGRTYSKLLGDWFWPGLTRLDALVIDDRTNPFVVVGAAGGAHSECWQVYTFSNNQIIEVLSTFSDAPSIKAKDVNGDGIKEIICKMRDYDRDPTVDSYQRIFGWTGTTFS